MTAVAPDDPRWAALADALVGRAVEVKPGERVMIAMSEVDSAPLAATVNAAVVRAGGYPQVQFLSETLRHDLLQHGSEEQLAWTPEIEAYGMEWADVYIALRGGRALDLHADVAADRMARNQAAQGRISTLRWQKTRWTLVRVPSREMAEDSGRDFEVMMDEFFNAALVDWEIEEPALVHLAERLNRSRSVRIEGPDTDLSFSVAGRTWVPAVGRINVPDGEVMTAPVEGTVHGVVTFEQPAVFGGRRIRDLRLRWDHGELVEATSSTEQDFLDRIIDTDPGARHIGEFALGTNRHLTGFADDILLDEKIAGTWHLALGRAYPECGGTVQSAVHWDIIKDTRQGGTVSVDGVPVLRDGIIAPAGESRGS